VFENRVLRRISGMQNDEVLGGWRKLHNEARHNLYFSPSIIRMIKSRRMGMGRACSTHGKEGQYVEDLGGKTRRKEPTTKTLAQLGG
jgi:hypothetical protein